MDNKIIRINELVKILNNASDEYYNSDKASLSNQEFDKLFDELKQLELLTNYIISSSPTQKVGYEIKSKLSKVTHTIPLKSLGKTKSIDEVKSFIGNHEVVAMLKGDGLTCEIIYDNTLLQQGSTRGNSIIGEDITHNVKTFKNIPSKIDFKGYLKLAGESVIFEKDFEIINNKLKEDDKYSNSRNLVAGSVRQLDSKICANRNVNFMAFSLLECKDENGEDVKLKTIMEQFAFLGSLGFYVIANADIKNNQQNIEKTIEFLKDYAVKSGTPIDGIVFAYNNLEYAKSLGETEHHPLGKLAMKFADDEYETKYIKTEWQVSRTSIINPVGVFQPVDLDGAITTKATLHNIDYFEALQLGENDIISVARMNMVIPKILTNKTRSNTEVIPTQCPICGEKTEVKLQKTARFLYCTNDNCPSKKVAQFEHFCSRDAMNIMGVSEAICEEFINKGFLKTIPDLYNLEQYKSQIVKMNGYGLKSYNKIIEGVNNSRKTTLANFLFALGIPNVGKGTSKDLAKYFNNDINYLLDDISYNKLIQMKDCGEITALSIMDYFGDIQNIELVNELLKYVEFEEDKQVIQSDSSIKDKVFVVTGDVFKFKNRKELEAKIDSLGGKVTGSVSAKTNYLINNDFNSPSSKNKKAKDLNISIINEDEFLDIIGEM